VLYFAEREEVQYIFRSHSFNTVPYLAVSSMNLKRDANMESFLKEEDKWLVSNNEVYDAQMQINFVNNHLATDVQLKFTFATIVLKNFLGMSILLAFATLVKYLYSFLLNQYVWFGVAMSVYVICTGGLVYSMLNSMPWFKFEKNEYGSIVVTEYFMRGQRGQWAGEGYIISVLSTFIGLTYLFLNKIREVFNDKSKLRMAVFISVAAIWIMQQLLLMAYRIKSPWYNPTFDPPDYYQRGSLLKDQGNNI